MEVWSETIYKLWVYPSLSPDLINTGVRFTASQFITPTHFTPTTKKGPELSITPESSDERSESTLFWPRIHENAVAVPDYRRNRGDLRFACLHFLNHLPN